jgi:hypothetical protein
MHITIPAAAAVPPPPPQQQRKPTSDQPKAWMD